MPFPDVFFDRHPDRARAGGAPKALRPLLRQLWRGAGARRKNPAGRHPTAPACGPRWNGRLSVMAAPFRKHRTGRHPARTRCWNPERWERALYAPPLKSRSPDRQRHGLGKIRGADVSRHRWGAYRGGGQVALCARRRRRKAVKQAAKKPACAADRWRGRNELVFASAGRSPPWANRVGAADLAMGQPFAGLHRPRAAVICSGQWASTMLAPVRRASGRRNRPGCTDGCWVFPTSHSPAPGCAAYVRRSEAPAALSNSRNWAARSRRALADPQKMIQHHARLFGGLDGLATGSPQSNTWAGIIGQVGVGIALHHRQAARRRRHSHSAWEISIPRPSTDSWCLHQMLQQRAIAAADIQHPCAGAESSPRWRPDRGAGWRRWTSQA